MEIRNGLRAELGEDAADGLLSGNREGQSLTSQNALPFSSATAAAAAALVCWNVGCASATGADLLAKIWREHLR